MYAAGAGPRPVPGRSALAGSPHGFTADPRNPALCHFYPTLRHPRGRAGRCRQPPAGGGRNQPPPAGGSSRPRSAAPRGRGRAAPDGFGGSSRGRGLLPGPRSAVRAGRAGPVPVPCAPALGGGSRGRCCRGSAIRSHRACPREEPVALWCVHRVAG